MCGGTATRDKNKALCLTAACCVSVILREQHSQNLKANFHFTPHQLSDPQQMNMATNKSIKSSIKTRYTPYQREREREREVGLKTDL